MSPLASKLLRPDLAAPERISRPDAWFCGKRVVVMGLGRFGGGVGVAKWLVSRGADVLITDSASEDELTGPIRELSKEFASGAIDLRLGDHNVGDFTTSDAVIVNPAVRTPWNNRFIRSTQAAGIPLFTEIGLVVDRLNQKRLVAVTGSAGKSTTSAMCYAGLVGAGLKAHLGGNIGGSLLGRLDEIDADDYVVLEVSSAMLWWLGGMAGAAFTPRVAVVTSYGSNHVDWHGTETHYIVSKQNIVRGLSEESTLVLGPGVEGWGEGSPATVLTIAPESGIDGLRVPGAHNRLNGGMAVRACAAVTGLDASAFGEGVRSFPGLPHRLHDAGTFGGVRCIDDSKSTTPGATALALDAARETLPLDASVHLIAGGYDKQVDLSAISRDLSRVAGVYTIGKTGAAIARLAGDKGLLCETLPEAVRRIARRARTGDVVLLSPGCASWDQFENYEQRGRTFAELASDLLTR